MLPIPFPLKLSSNKASKFESLGLLFLISLGLFFLVVAAG